MTQETKAKSKPPRRLLALLLLMLATPALAQGRYIIADQDASNPADIALMLLLRAPEAHLLGITIVSGNAWRDEEVAHALRLVEGMGRADVPVLAGAAFPLVRTAEETRLYDQLYGKPFFLGPFADPHAPAGWDTINPANLPEGLPHTHASDEDAAHFMVRMVHEHPHQVTIWAAGPLTNVALACRIDPHFTELAEELVLMGAALHPRPKPPSGSIGPDMNSTSGSIQRRPALCSASTGPRSRPPPSTSLYAPAWNRKCSMGWRRRTAQRPNG